MVKKQEDHAPWKHPAVTSGGPAHGLKPLATASSASFPPMVAISITPAKGNAGARWFPHSGHLGLSPVKLEGVVRTRIEEDGKTATSSGVTISIRCYEARLGRVGVTKTNVLYEESQTLWSPEGVYGQLGSLELPFRLTVAPNAGGHSTFQLPEYRVYWRIEAAIHTPHIAGIGTRQVKCFDVNLVRYNKLSPQPTVYHAPAPHCELQLPRQPVAPLDPIPLSVRIHTPPGTVQRVTLTLERQVELFDVSPSSSTTQLATPSILSRQSSRESSPGCCSSTMALLPPSPDRPSSSSGLAPKTIEAVLATTDITEIPRPTGSNSLTAMLQVPLPKSNAHWGVGETMHGELARVRFFITAKVQMALGGSEFTEFCQEEITVVAVDDAERLRVHSKYRMKRPATSPSSSVENHSEKRPVPHLPSPPPSPNNLAVPKNKAKRPHTSSGTREPRHPLRPRSRGNETTPVPTAFEPEQFRAWERELDRIAPPRPRSSTGLRLFGSKKRSSPEPRPAATRTVVVPSAKTAEVLEWEAEVERFSSASAREAVLRRGPLGVPC